MESFRRNMSGRTLHSAIVWDNELLRLQDEPIIENDHTLVPLRELLEKLGVEIVWDPVSRKVTAGKDGNWIELAVDSDTAFINGEAKKLETPERIRDGRTYVPARLVLETFGAKVGWQPESRLMLVSTEGGLPILSSEDHRGQLAHSVFGRPLRAVYPYCHRKSCGGTVSKPSSFGRISSEGKGFGTAIATS